jgi:hypothetical protein
MKTHPHAIIFPNGGKGVTDPPDGLTKREYFASLAMQGYLASGKDLKASIMIRNSVILSDELIKQLNSDES